MALTPADLRILIKRSTNTGEVPTVAPSTDHTDGTWDPLDIYKGELFINTADDKVWYRGDAGIVQIYPSAGGISSLNGLTAATQTFAVNTSGSDFGISSSTSTHTFSLPTASALNRGALSSSDWSTFNAKIGGSLTAGRVPYASGASTLTDSANLYWDNTNVRLGVGTSSPSTRLHVSGVTAYNTGVLVEGNTATGVGIILKNTQASANEWLICSAGSSNGGGVGSLFIYNITEAGQNALTIQKTTSYIGVYQQSPTAMVDIYAKSASYNVLRAKANGASQYSLNIDSDGCVNIWQDTAPYSSVSLNVGSKASGVSMAIETDGNGKGFCVVDQANFATLQGHGMQFNTKSSGSVTINTIQFTSDVYNQTISTGLLRTTGIAVSSVLNQAPTAMVHVTGVDSTSSNYALKVDNSGGTALMYVRNDGVVLMNNLPTSSAGLPSGALWNNSGVINIV